MSVPTPIRLQLAGALALVAGGCGSAALSTPRLWSPAAEQGKTPISVPAFMDRRPSLGAAVEPALMTPKRRVVRGVSVFVAEKHDLPLVAVTVLIAAGVAHESAPGVACATAEMLDEGAGRRSAVALAAALAQLGARLRIECSWDFTSIGVRVLRRHVEAVLPLLFDVVRRPRLGRSDFERIIGQLEARALARRAEPSRVAQLTLRRAVFGSHPYGRPRLALPAQLRRLRRAQLRAFHRRFYRRSRASVVVVGDLAEGEAVAWLRGPLSTWRAGGRAVRRRRVVRARSSKAGLGVRLVLVDRPGAAQSVLRVGVLGPARKTSVYPQLRLVHVALGGSFTSRLNQSLREKHGFSYGAHSALWLRRTGGMLWAGAAVKTSVTVRAVEQVIREIRGVAQRALTPRELHKAQQILIGELAEQLETVDSLTHFVSEIATLGLPLDSMQRLVRTAQRADSAALTRAVQGSLRTSELAVVIVGDSKRLRKPLQARFGPPLLADTDGLPQNDG